MPAPPVRRRLTIQDGMALIAAAALGLAWARPVLEQFPQSWPRRLTFEVITEVSMLSLPTVVCWTLAVTVLSLLGPRPSRRLFRQPGVVACLAVAIVLAVGMPVIVAGTASGNGPYSPLLRDDWIGTSIDMLAMLSGYAAVAILASWAVLILNRRWRPEPTGIDRLGRDLGVFWAASGAVFSWVLMREF